MDDLNRRLLVIVSSLCLYICGEDFLLFAIASNNTTKGGESNASKQRASR